MKLPTSPERLWHQLLNPWTVSRPPGRSVVDTLVTAHAKAEPEDRIGFGESLATLLRNWKIPIKETEEERGEALQDVLELARRTRTKEATAPLQNLVAQRSLTAPVGAYSDLHGRALEALYAVGVLDLILCWKTEVKYRVYAPLAFAFVRERDPWYIPEMLADVAQLGFLREALRTVIVRYPEKGLEILLRCARKAKGLSDSTVLDELLGALPRLGLKVTEEDAVRRELGSFGPPVRVWVHLGGELDPLVRESLQNVGFEVLRQGWQARPGDWVIVPSFSHPEGLGERSRVFEVFDENDPQESSGSHSKIIIPAFNESPEEKVEVIRDRMLSALHAHWLAQKRQDKPPIPDTTTMEARSPAGKPDQALAALACIGHR
jgi:hypothetical protein